MKRLLPVAAATLALASLSGCSSSPLTAATVGGQTITVHDVDVVGNALCIEHAQAAAAGQASGVVATSTVKQSALGALVESAIDNQFARQHKLGYDPLQLAKQMQQVAPLIASLPAGDQQDATTLISDLLRGQLQLSTAAVAVLKQTGQSVTQQSVSAAIGQLEAQISKNLKVTVNPRYNLPSKDPAGAGSQAMSDAVSQVARSGIGSSSATQADPNYAAALPPSQRCG